MKTDVNQPNLSEKAVLFDSAKEIYALHSAISQLTNIQQHQEYRNELLLRPHEV